MAPIEKKIHFPDQEESPYESHQDATQQPEQSTPSWIKREKVVEQPSFMPASSERAHSAQSRKSNSQSSALDHE